jgi:hypothetical protein
MRRERVYQNQNSVLLANGTKSFEGVTKMLQKQRVQDKEQQAAAPSTSGGYERYAQPGRMEDRCDGALGRLAGGPQPIP